MVTNMKTTVDIADSLLRRAKERAAQRGVTLKAVIEDSLRDALNEGDGRGRAFELQTHVFGGEGLQAGLSWGDWETLQGLAYEGRGG